jgi:hypothetical protein
MRLGHFPHYLSHLLPGIPAYYFYKLWRARDEIKSSNTESPKVQVLSMLYASYLPGYCFFEIVETTRQLALTAVLSVISTGTSTQVVVGMLILFAYICIYSQSKPYLDARNTTLASVGQYQIYFTFFGSLNIVSEEFEFSNPMQQQAPQETTNHHDEDDCDNSFNNSTEKIRDADQSVGAGIELSLSVKCSKTTTRPSVTHHVICKNNNLILY